MIKIKTTKTALAKSVAVNAVQYSVSFTVGAIIHATCPTANQAQKVKMVVGSYAIGAMVADQAGKYIGEQINALESTIKSIKTKSEVIAE